MSRDYLPRAGMHLQVQSVHRRREGLIDENWHLNTEVWELV